MVVGTTESKILFIINEYPFSCRTVVLEVPNLTILSMKATKSNGMT